MLGLIAYCLFVLSQPPNPQAPKLDGDFWRTLNMVKESERAQQPHGEQGLADIAALEACAGKCPAAMRTAAWITSPRLRAVAMSSVAIGYAVEGNIPMSLDVAKQLPDPSRALYAIAVVRGRRGDFESAAAAAEMITAPERRRLGILRIAEFRLAAGQRETAIALVERAVAIEPAVTDPGVLARLAILYGRAERPDRAGAFVEVLLASRGDPDFERALAKVAVAEAESRRTDRAVSLVGRLSDWHARKDALAGIGIARLNHGDEAGGLRMIADAGPDEELWPDLVLRHLVQRHVKRGTFADALAFAHDFRSWDEHALALIDIAAAQAPSDPAGARETLDQCRAVLLQADARPEWSASKCATIVAALAQCELRCGSRQRAVARIDEALDLARAITRRAQTGLDIFHEHWIHIAAAQRELGDNDAAAQTMEMALAEHSDERTRFLDGTVRHGELVEIAVQFALSGVPARAVDLAWPTAEEPIDRGMLSAVSSAVARRSGLAPVVRDIIPKVPEAERSGLLLSALVATIERAGLDTAPLHPDDPG